MSLLLLVILQRKLSALVTNRSELRRHSYVRGYVVHGNAVEHASREGRAFSDKFYTSFYEQSGKEYVDLAQALQSAVVNIMQDTQTRSFRYWAPLVLHGAWFCKRLEEIH